ARAAQPALLERLLEEHRDLLPALQAWIERLPGAPAARAWQELSALAERLRLPAHVEDEPLFAAMAARLGPAALTGYLMQHDDIDEVLGQLLQTPGQLPDGAPELADLLLWYCESHFEIEERHIFQEALARLTPQQWAELEVQARALAARSGDGPPAPQQATDGS
ncbi:MAG: hypothetical protein GX496_06895, partial [Firmicutes bacterium]|nr:hypothetical protein [Bacillota bacterium]